MAQSLSDQINYHCCDYNNVETYNPFDYKRSVESAHTLPIRPTCRFDLSLANWHSSNGSLQLRNAIVCHYFVPLRDKEIVAASSVRLKLE